MILARPFTAGVRLRIRDSRSRRDESEKVFFLFNRRYLLLSRHPVVKDRAKIVPTLRVALSKAVVTTFAAKP